MNNPEESKIIRDARDNWTNHWTSLLRQVDKSENGLMSNFRFPFIKRAGSFKMSYEFVESAVRPAGDKLILEAGCGTGNIAAKMTEGGAKIVVMDTSESALKITMEVARNRGVEVVPVQGSVLELPFKEGVFEMSFNIGVVDHFGIEHRRTARDEMLRVLTDSGKALIAVNDARSIVHPLAMKHAKKRGKWPFGYKAAIRTWEDMFGDNVKWRRKEYSRGFISQFEFMRYFLPDNPFTTKMFFRIFFVISWPLAFLNRFPGFLRIFEIVKKGEQ